MHTDLWKFAIHLYARPGVEPACLALQDAGADVCLLLCAAWLQAGKAAVTSERLEHLQQLAGAWQQQAVTPLRQLRQQWRTAARHDPQLAQLREQVKALELQAERTLLERLQQASEGWMSEGVKGDWLALLAPQGTEHHGALQVLRAAAVANQEAVEGD